MPVHAIALIFPISSRGGEELGVNPCDHMETVCFDSRREAILDKSMGSYGTTAPALAMQRLGAALRRRRKDLRLNQAELAALAGVGLAFLYELEHGKATVRIDKLLAVLGVLGVELELREGKDVLRIAPALAGEAP